MGVTPEQATLLGRWASDHDAVIAVWLFGSRARGDNRPDSDFDIALELAPKHGKLDDPAFTAFFFGYQQWKAQVAKLLDAEISLVCYREDLDCKFDPRVFLVWTRAA